MRTLLFYLLLSSLACAATTTQNTANVYYRAAGIIAGNTNNAQLFSRGDGTWQPMTGGTGTFNGLPFVMSTNRVGLLNWGSLTGGDIGTNLPPIVVNGGTNQFDGFVWNLGTIAGSGGITTNDANGLIALGIYNLTNANFIVNGSITGNSFTLGGSNITSWTQIGGGSSGGTTNIATVLSHGPNPGDAGQNSMTNIDVVIANRITETQGVAKISWNTNDASGLLLDVYHLLVDGSTNVSATVPSTGFVGNVYQRLDTPNTNNASLTVTNVNLTPYQLQSAPNTNNDALGAAAAVSNKTVRLVVNGTTNTVTVGIGGILGDITTGGGSNIIDTLQSTLTASNDAGGLSINNLASIQYDFIPGDHREVIGVTNKTLYRGGNEVSLEFGNSRAFGTENNWSINWATRRLYGVWQDTNSNPIVFAYAGVPPVSNQVLTSTGPLTVPTWKDLAIGNLAITNGTYLNMSVGSATNASSLGGLSAANYAQTTQLAGYVPTNDTRYLNTTTNNAAQLTIGTLPMGRLTVTGTNTPGFVLYTDGVGGRYWSNAPSGGTAGAITNNQTGVTLNGGITGQSNGVGVAGGIVTNWNTLPSSGGSSVPLYTNANAGASLIYDTTIGALCVSNPTWGILPLTLPNLYATAPGSGQDVSNLTAYFVESTTRTWSNLNVGGTWTIANTNNHLLIATTGESVQQWRAILTNIPNPNLNWTNTMTFERMPFYSTDTSTAPGQYLGIGVMTNATLGSVAYAYVPVNTTTTVFFPAAYKNVFTNAPTTDSSATGDASILVPVLQGAVMLQMIYNAATTNLTYSYAIVTPGMAPQFVQQCSTTVSNATPKWIGIFFSRFGSGDTTKPSSQEIKAWQFIQ